jgi:Yip1-like protein
MTIDAAGPAPVHPAPVTPAKGSWERLFGVLFSPGETFADIARKPTVLVPLLLFIVIGYISVIVMVPRMDWESVSAQQAQQMKKQRPNMSDADIERASKVGKAVGSVMMYVSPLLGVLWYLVVALVLFGAVRLMGGEGTFKQAFSATLYAWMPLVLFSIILTIVIIARGSIDPTQMATAFKSNPAFLVDMKEQPVLFSLLSSIDLFTIWTIVLLIFGFSALSRLSWAKTATIVVGLWVVMVMVKIGFAALTASQAAA